MKMDIEKVFLRKEIGDFFPKGISGLCLVQPSSKKNFTKNLLPWTVF